MQTVVTHSGSFDPDDVLAVASLQLYLGEENIKIIRSRQRGVIEKGDWVVDVGGEYDVERKRFDHHQNGVPKREDGVPYSAFGLIWKECGEEICGSKDIADVIERKLVQPIDAADNHVTICHPGQAGLSAFEFFDVIDSFKPVRGTEETYKEQFLKAVDFARGLLSRLIAHQKSHTELHEMIRDTYEADKNKSVIEFDEHIPRHALVYYEEVQVVVCPAPAEDVDRWAASVVPVNDRSFQNRAVFPEAWGGLAHDELEEASGIEGAVFCHKERYIFVAETKEAAMKAAHRART